MNSRGYKSEKRRKELAQQKKQEEKRLRRLTKKHGPTESYIDADGNVVEKVPVDETAAAADAATGTATDAASGAAADAATGAEGAPQSTEASGDASPDTAAAGTMPEGAEGKSGQA